MAERYSDGEVVSPEYGSSNAIDELLFTVVSDIELLPSMGGDVEINVSQAVYTTGETILHLLQNNHDIDVASQILQSRQNSEDYTSSESPDSDCSTAGAEKPLDSYLCHEIGQIFTRCPPTQDENSPNVDITVQASPEMPGMELKIQDDLWSRQSSFFLNFHAKIWSETIGTALDEHLKRFTGYAVVDVIILVPLIIAGIYKLRQCSTVLSNECSALTVQLAASAVMIIISFFHVMCTQNNECTLEGNNQWKNRPTSSGTIHGLTEHQAAANVNGCDTDHRWKLLYLTTSHLFDSSNGLKHAPCTVKSSEFSAVNNINTGVATKGIGMIHTLPDTPAQSDSSKHGSAAENLSSESIRPSKTIHTNEESSQTEGESSNPAEEKIVKCSTSRQYTAKVSIRAQEEKGYASGTQPVKGCYQRFNIHETGDNIQSKTRAAETSQVPRPRTTYPYVRHENIARGEWVSKAMSYVTTHLLSQSSGTGWKMGQSNCYVYTEHTAKKSRNAEVRDTNLQDLEPTSETVVSPVITKNPHKESEKSGPLDIGSVPGTTGMDGQKRESVDAKRRGESRQPSKTEISTPMETRTNRKKRIEVAIPSDSDNSREILDRKSETKGKTSQSCLYSYKKPSVQYKNEICESSTTEVGKSDSLTLKDRVRPRTPKSSLLGKITKTEHSKETLAETGPPFHASHSCIYTCVKRPKAELHEKTDPGYFVRRRREVIPSNFYNRCETPDRKIETKGKTGQLSHCRYKELSEVQSKDEISESSVIEAGKSDSQLLKDWLRRRTPKPSLLGKIAKTEQLEATLAETGPFFDAADSSLHTCVKRLKAEAHEADLVLNLERNNGSAEVSTDLAAQSTEASTADYAESSMNHYVKAETQEETEARSSMFRLKRLCQDWETVFVIRGPADTEYVIHKIPDGVSVVNECHDICPSAEIELVLKMLEIMNETNTRIKQAVSHKYERNMSDYFNECSVIKRLLRIYIDILISAICGDVTPHEPFRMYRFFRENAKAAAKFRSINSFSSP